MSEQTDPLAQLVDAAGEEWQGEGTPGEYIAAAIRAAVLADPTIVGMERAGWLTPDFFHFPEAPWAEHVEANPDAAPLYRTPEVKG